jgi:Domain of unknown function (DUF4838)/Glycosyl hydrolase family 67 N-terminus
MRMMNEKLLWRALACFVFATVLLMGAARIVHAEDAPSPQNSITVFPGKNQDTVVAFAAHELQQYLEKITGGSVTLGDVSASHRLYVGEMPAGIPATEAQKLRDDLSALQQDGFIIRSVGPDVVLLGKGDRGYLYACYAFLERLGVRWYFPGSRNEVVPHAALNWNETYTISESPAFRKRILFYWPNNYSSVEDWIDFAAKLRLNCIMFHYTWPARDWYINLRPQLQPELAKRGMEIEVGGHFLSSFLPRNLIKTHPDWFRMDKNGRRLNDYNLDPFNSQALNYLASGAVNYLLKMPDATLFHLWADDISGGGWSHDPGKEQYTPSDQALLVYNDVVRRLRQKLPNARLSFLAYHDTVFPTRVVKPAPGIAFFYAPRERCYAHALDDPACPLNRQYSNALENALPEFNRTDAEVFEYYTDEILFENLTDPPLPGVISQDARYYQRLGISGVGSLMTNTSNFTTPMTDMFLYAEALWNPNSDLWKSLDEYAALYFGDPGLKEYFRELNLGLKDVLKVCPYHHPGDAWDSLGIPREDDSALEFRVRNLQEVLTGPLAGAADLLDQAARSSSNGIYGERLAGEQKSMNFVLRQVTLFYHLLKGELLYRQVKARHDPETGVALGTELALARYQWERQKEFAARTSLKGRLLVPDPEVLGRQWSELVRQVSHPSPHVVEHNPASYSTDTLFEHLQRGVAGTIVSDDWGSVAVVWTDLPASKNALQPSRQGLVWLDEFGRPLKAGSLNLYTEPVVVRAQGMSADKLFDALAASQQ